MPDVQDVYRIATQRVHPEPGFVERQHDHRDKQARRRKVGAVVVVAAMAVLIGAIVVRDLSDERQSQPGGRVHTSVGPIDLPPLSVVGPPTHRHNTVRSPDGVPFSFTVSTPGWERFGNISINKSDRGPQGAEAIIYWSVFPDGGYTDPYGHQADPCTQVLGSHVGLSAADLAATISAAPGTELVSGPSDVTIGGNPAKLAELTVRSSRGCDPGFFYAWQDYFGGAMWPTTEEGTTMRIWIVDVDGKLLFIAAATAGDALPGLAQEAEQIVQSIRFD